MVTFGTGTKVSQNLFNLRLEKNSGKKSSKGLSPTTIANR